MRSPDDTRKVGRNQLVGRVVDIKIDGLIGQVTVSIGEQCITSIISADAIREMQLKPGQTITALIKSTEVMMILRGVGQVSHAA